MTKQKTSSRVPWRTFIAGFMIAILMQRLLKMLDHSTSIAKINPDY